MQELQSKLSDCKDPLFAVGGANCHRRLQQASAHAVLPLGTACRLDPRP
jgi:hypothetical protein